MSDEKSWGKPAIDPMKLRSILMLDVAREMMISDPWTHKAAFVSPRRSGLLAGARIPGRP